MKITVRDLMTARPSAVETSTTIGDVLRLLLQEGISEVYVMDSTGTLVGVVPDYSLLKAQLNQTSEMAPVDSLMSRSVQVVHPNTTATEIVSVFRESRIRRMAVVEEGRLVGQISRRDLMRLLCMQDLLEKCEEPAETVTFPAGTNAYWNLDTAYDSAFSLLKPKHARTLQRSDQMKQSR
jgi:CBS domain-containing protein